MPATALTRVLARMGKDASGRHTYAREADGIVTGTDGLVFTPVEESYAIPAEKLLKWKRREHLTVDFFVVRGDVEAGGPSVKLYVAGLEKNLAVASAVLTPKMLVVLQGVGARTAAAAPRSCGHARCGGGGGGGGGGSA